MTLRLRFVKVTEDEHECCDDAHCTRSNVQGICCRLHICRHSERTQTPERRWPSHSWLQYADARQVLRDYEGLDSSETLAAHTDQLRLENVRSLGQHLERSNLARRQKVWLAQESIDLQDESFRLQL